MDSTSDSSLGYVRPSSLAPYVRSAAAIGEANELVGRPSVRWPAQVDIPGSIHTPGGTPEARRVGLPPPESNASMRSLTSAGNQPVVEVPYQFTLADLNKRSYFLVHEEKNTSLPADLKLLNEFRDHVRKAVLLANLEVCFVRSCQMANQSHIGGCMLRLGDPVLLDPLTSNDAAAEQHALELRRKENKEALSPMSELLTGKGSGHYKKRHLLGKLRREAQLAEQLLNQQGMADELEHCSRDVLTELAFTFAAYQPAVLDEVVKGSMSPLDKKSRTKTIEDVQKKIEDARDEKAETDAPQVLAELARKLTEAVRRDRPGFNMAAWLLQAACMSGHFELVDVLLDGRSDGTHYLGEMDIMKRLRAAWIGYTGYKPLQPTRGTGMRKPHTIDWLDFKCSIGRAVLIAHRIVDTLIEREDLDVTQSVQLPAGSDLKQQPPPRAIPANGAHSVQSRENSRTHYPSRLAKLNSREEQQQAAVALDATTPNGGAAAAELVSSATPTCRPPHLAPLQPTRGVQFDDPSATPMSTTAAAAAAVAGNVSGRGQVEVEYELTDIKWGLLKELFDKRRRRSAACKPLAIAMMHFILMEKKIIFRDIQAEKEQRESERAQREAQAKIKAGKVGSVSRNSRGSADNALAGADSYIDEEDPNEEEAEEEEQKRKDEEALTAQKYRKLHKLSVQACHLAIHSTSLSVVSDGLQVIKAVKAWPAIDLHMLNDLAQYFPMQCQQLLEAIPLEEVDLEDNVLPFSLPPGFVTVAVSDKDSKEFREEGGSGSTQDAAHFATQHDEDVSIEASLLVLGRVWLALLFLFLPAEFRSPTTRNQLRVMRCALAAFLWQGPGSCCVALACAALLLIVGLASRVVVALFRIVYWGLLHRLWVFSIKHFPALKKLVDRVRGRAHRGVGSKSLTANPSALNMRKGSQIAPGTSSMAATPVGGAQPQIKGSYPFGPRSSSPVFGAAEEGEEGAVSDDYLSALTTQLGKGLWRRFFAHGHNAVIDGAVGWGKGSTSISCRKVPMAVQYADRSAPRQQLDSSLLEKLLNAPGIHPSVFGSRVLKALILFKWNYFTKYFIILQFLLHVTYMSVFLAYAFSIKDMEPVDGRETGPGANQPGCMLEAPSGFQIGLLVALSVMTLDFVVQEFRQIRHFGLRILKHTWDLLDMSSVALVVASITLHFSCTSDVSPLTLRGLASVQIILLFMRLLYYAMASDKLGSFVRMVLETTYDLLLFFLFLSVIFVGFALAIIVAQGSMADEEQVFIKLFTMMYGDFDADFLVNIESGALGLDALTRVLASVYMILVTIILLNLLISVISESYERIRENERWESLRNKALLIVESETQLYQFFLSWLYRTLTPASESSQGKAQQSGKRYLYVITPENARRAVAPDDDAADEDDDDDDDDDGDDEGADGQWNGRLGEMKRHISSAGRATLDSVRKEMKKVLDEVKKQTAPLEEPEEHAAGEGHDGGGGEYGGAAGAEPSVAPWSTSPVVAPQQQQQQQRPSRGSSSAALLDASALQAVSALTLEMAALRADLTGQLAKMAASQQQLAHGYGPGHGARPVAAVVAAAAAGVHSPAPSLAPGHQPPPLGRQPSQSGMAAPPLARLPSMSGVGLPPPLPPLLPQRVSDSGSGSAPGQGSVALPALRTEMSEMLHDLMASREHSAAAPVLAPPPRVASPMTSGSLSDA